MFPAIALLSLNHLTRVCWFDGSRCRDTISAVLREKLGGVSRAARRLQEGVARARVPARDVGRRPAPGGGARRHERGLPRRRTPSRLRPAQVHSNLPTTSSLSGTRSDGRSGWTHKAVH